MNRIRNLVGAVVLAVAATGMTVPAAQADVAWNLQVSVGSYGNDYHRGYRHRHIEHAAHRFFDGRLYCAGKDGWGRWVSDARCEDEYGRKLVNDPRFVKAVLRNERGWRNDRGWRSERHPNWRNDRFGYNR